MRACSSAITVEAMTTIDTKGRMTHRHLHLAIARRDTVPGISWRGIFAGLSLTSTILIVLALLWGLQ
jgi:hypothetical protein